MFLRIFLSACKTTMLQELYLKRSNFDRLEPSNRMDLTLIEILTTMGGHHVKCLPKTSKRSKLPGCRTMQI